MAESQHNQSNSHPQISLSRPNQPTSADVTANLPAESGQDLLHRMGSSIQENSLFGKEMGEKINIGQVAEEQIAEGQIVEEQIAEEQVVQREALFAPGELIDQKYQVIKLLGRGKVGLVYQARHIMLDKIFAIKVLAPEEPLQDVSVQRFQREAYAASSLNHANIIAVHDFGVMENGMLYLVMEYLAGETLADWLNKEQRLDFRKALPIFMQVCLALEYAHDKGLVHRDLKPSNIMLVKDYKGDDIAKVIDFGIAKFTVHKPDLKTLTKPGQIFGSPLYMSPEQCQGKKPDHRSDIYSLGCVMYEALCGAPPLMGETLLNTIYKHVNEVPSPFSQHAQEYPLPKDLEAIVFRALAKQPENRYQSARELLQMLESFNQYYQQTTDTFKHLNSFSLSAMKKILLPESEKEKTEQPSLFLPLLFFSIICFIIVLGLFFSIRTVP